MPKNLGAKGDYFAKKHIKNIRKKKWRKSHHKDYITTGEAYRKLQLSPAVFRRFMVIKGIHPVLPKKKTLAKKAYYNKKDIAWVIHDKMMKDYRDRITYTKKQKKLHGRHDWHKLDKHNATPPARDFDYVVKERYPTFADALGDIDDALTLIASIARIQARLSFNSGVINDCARLIREFEAYVAKSGCLTKAFVSVKGIYYQAEIMAQRITWLTPFDFHMKLPTKQVDVSLLTNYTEFYRTFIGFVNYKLYTSAGYEYPPNIQDNGNDPGIGAVDMKLKINSLYDSSREADKKRSQLTRSEKAVERSINSKFVKVKEEADAPEASDSVIVIEDADDDIPQELKEEQEEAKPVSDKLFNGLVFWANRECMRGPLDLVIRSFGGRVSWFGCDEMTESDSIITHHIVDKKVFDKVAGREYIQPQWVFDSINNNILLPIHEYAPGVSLPPHLSPFINDDHKGYMPDQRVHLDELIEAKLNKMASKAFEGEEKIDEEEEEEEEDEAEAVENRFEIELAAELEGESYENIGNIGKPEPEPELHSSDSDYDTEEEEKKKSAPPKKVKKPKKLTKEQLEDAEAHELSKFAMSGQALGKYRFLAKRDREKAKRNKLITDRKASQEAQDKADKKDARKLRKKKEVKDQKSQERMARKRAAAAEASQQEKAEVAAPVETEAPKRKSAGSSKEKPAKKQKSTKH